MHNVCYTKGILFSMVYLQVNALSELSGFACTSSLTMNEKFAVLKILSSLLSEQVELNPGNSRAMSVLTFYFSNRIHCTNKKNDKSSNFEPAKAMV